MSTPTPTSGAPVPPVIMSGAELYNQIMSGIEVDLTTENMPTLDAKYAGENETDQKVRMTRYGEAFAEYQKQFEEYQKKQSEEIRTFGITAISYIENKDRAADNDALNSLETSMQNI